LLGGRSVYEVWSTALLLTLVAIDGREWGPEGGHLEQLGIELGAPGALPVHRRAADPANPFAGIRLTILGISRPKRKAPEARAALTAFAAEHSRREAELESLAEKLRADRDKAIRKAYKAGLPMSAIAEVLEISHQRVSQIVRS
jgi:hypothetical protein